MDLSLTDEQKSIVDQVRRFVREEIAPLEDSLDPDADALPPEDHARLTGKVKQMGLYGLDIPPEYGGPDIDIVTRTLLAIEMSQHRAGLYAPCYDTFGGAGLAQMFEAALAQGVEKAKGTFAPTLRDGTLGAATELLRSLVLEEECPDFLTLRAYEHID